ncbi:MAG: serine hydrolase [Lachnospiraceae bacterium]|nr:serine hydrolase [Lachnospiraceae bacterium]
MKCINRYIALILICIISISFCACDSNNIKTYKLENTSAQYGLVNTIADENIEFFGSDKCVTSNDNFGLNLVDSHVAQGGGVFNLSTHEVTYGQNLFGKMYPASTTKILTALVAIENADLNQMITVSEYAADQSSDSSVANLKAGDVMSLKDLLYGLMLRSGNDAAIAIAEGVAGDEEHFAELMNKKAREFGATHSHFITPHGLHKDDHYTTIYDMYLIFSAAIKNETFLSIISTEEYSPIYTGIDGTEKTQTWYNTNQYLLGKSKAPEGFTVIGGKTGTTYEAGYCLVLYSKNSAGEDIISIVYNADCALNLYYLTNQLLYTFGDTE